jgi:flagellar biosynthesis protein FlhB
MQERSEQATPRRRLEAREKGQVPRSVELNVAVLLLGSALVVAALAPMLGQAVLTTFEYGIFVAAAGPLDAHSAVALVRGIGVKVLAALIAFLSAISGVALLIAAGQARGVLTVKPLEPKWERIDPLPNLKRMLGSQPWMELLKSLLKLLVVGVAVHFSLRAAWPDAMTLAMTSPIGMLDLVRRYSVRLLLTAGSCYLVLAALDYVYQMWRHEKNLRMTKQEVKQEVKQSEGDPLVKARMRSMGRELARGQMLKDVRKADVIITSNAQVAIAVRYDPARSDAPVVLAIGQRELAGRIRAIALEAGVPMAEDGALARALLPAARVGAAIPSELFMAVAEVLASMIRERVDSSDLREATV